MKLVQMTGACGKRFGDDIAIKMIKEAGFDGYDFSMTDDNKNIGILMVGKNMPKI